jgi:hypothetical protein
MSILSKRVPGYKVNIDENGRDHGEIGMIFELASEKLLLREIKTAHTTVVKEYDFENCKFDIFRSSEFGEQSILGDAVAGGILFGGAGAVVGALSGKGRDSWIFEIVEGDSVELFRLRNDQEKKTLEKYINKHSR